MNHKSSVPYEIFFYRHVHLSILAHHFLPHTDQCTSRLTFFLTVSTAATTVLATMPCFLKKCNLLLLVLIVIVILIYIVGRQRRHTFKKLNVYR